MSESNRQNVCETSPSLIGRNIATNSFLSLGGILSGFVLQILAAKYFGASPAMDTFLVAFLLLSFLLSQLQSGGILATAFIPSFNRALSEGSKEAKAFFSAASIFSSLLAICFSLLCFILAEAIVHLLGVGLSPESAALAVRIFRIFSLMFLPLTLSALFSASLRAEGRFFAAAFGPIAVNCCIVISIVILVTRAGIMSYVWGWTLGLLCQLVIVMRPLFSWPTLSFRLVSWKDPHLRVFAKTASILLLDVLSGLLLLSMERNMASALAVGTVSHMNYAKSLYTLPLRLVVSPAQVVLFSLFAQHFAVGRTGELKRVSTKALNLVIFLMLPTALFIMCFSREIVQLVYERGRFTEQDTRATAVFLTFYSLSIPALAIWWQLRIMSFALRNTAFPFAAGILALVLFYFGNRALLGPMGAPSLALNWAFAYYAASLALGAGLAYRYGISIWSSLVKSLWKLSPAVLSASGCIIVFQRLSLIPTGPDGALWVVAVRVAIYGTAGLATYLAVAWAFRVEEVKTVFAISYDRLESFWSYLRAVLKR